MSSVPEWDETETKTGATATMKTVTMRITRVREVSPAWDPPVDVANTALPAGVDLQADTAVPAEADPRAEEADTKIPEEAGPPVDGADTEVLAAEGPRAEEADIEVPAVLTSTPSGPDQVEEQSKVLYTPPFFKDPINHLA